MHGLFFHLLPVWCELSAFRGRRLLRALSPVALVTAHKNIPGICHSSPSHHESSLCSWSHSSTSDQHVWARGCRAAWGLLWGTGTQTTPGKSVSQCLVRTGLSPVLLKLSQRKGNPILHRRFSMSKRLHVPFQAQDLMLVVLRSGCSWDVAPLQPEYSNGWHPAHSVALGRNKCILFLKKAQNALMGTKPLCQTGSKSLFLK